MLDFIAYFDILLLVIYMNSLENIVVTEIQQPLVVHSKKGRTVQMTDRKSYGLSLCISGQITYTMNGKQFISNQSNAVILPQSGTYTLFGDKEGVFPVINFKCENFNCDEIIVFQLENPQLCLQNFECLKHLFLCNKSNPKTYSVFYELLDNVICNQGQKESFIDFVVKYLEENIQNPKLSNTELAKHLGISEVYLRKLFLSRYRITPKQYILDIRIRKAKQMLIGTPFTVAAIAEECGFSSVHHFCRCFKQRTGKTPTQYLSANIIYKI